MIRFELFLKNSNIDRVTAGWRRAAPGAQEKKFFGDHVRNENSGEVTKFGYHTITGVDIPEPNVVLWVLLTAPPIWVGLNRFL